MRQVGVILLALAVGAWIAGTNPAWGQESRATLGGRVVDAQGSAVPNADVAVTSDDTGVKQQTKTNEQGNWTVKFLVPGHYSFNVSAPGFKQAERHGITLQTSDTIIPQHEEMLAGTLRARTGARLPQPHYANDLAARESAR